MPQPPDTLEVVLGTHELLLQVSPKYSWYSFSFTQAATEEGVVEVGKEQNKAFETSKSQLTTDRTIIHYDPSKPIIMACDASIPAWSWCGDFSQVI